MFRHVSLLTYRYRLEIYQLDPNYAPMAIASWTYDNSKASQPHALYTEWAWALAEEILEKEDNCWLTAELLRNDEPHVDFQISGHPERLAEFLKKLYTFCPAQGIRSKSILSLSIGVDGPYYHLFNNYREYSEVSELDGDYELVRTIKAEEEAS